MNKPAPKEPSMDEILSSIRQIIADDDAGAAPRKPITPVPPPPPLGRMPTPPAPTPPAIEPEEPEPFALSAEQILRDVAAEDGAGAMMSFDEILGSGGLGKGPAPLVDPDDISFEIEEDDEPAPPPAAATPRFTPTLPLPERAAPRPVSQAAPMPDRSLSADMAEQLLEPAAQSAVKSTFARLNNFSTIGSNVTIEQMMREMLRPMLKEWLDENLPSMVERLVEQEIVRVSRGGR